MFTFPIVSSAVGSSQYLMSGWLAFDRTYRVSDYKEIRQRILTQSQKIISSPDPFEFKPSRDILFDMRKYHH